MKGAVNSLVYKDHHQELGSLRESFLKALFLQEEYSVQNRGIRRINKEMVTYGQKRRVLNFFFRQGTGATESNNGFAVSSLRTPPLFLLSSSLVFSCDTLLDTLSSLDESSIQLSSSTEPSSLDTFCPIFYKNAQLFLGRHHSFCNNFLLQPRS